MQDKDFDFIECFSEKEREVILKVVRFCTEKGYPKKRREAVFRKLMDKFDEGGIASMTDDVEYLLETFILEGYYIEENRPSLDWSNEMGKDIPLKTKISERGFHYYKNLSTIWTKTSTTDIKIVHYNKLPWFVEIIFTSPSEFRMAAVLNKDDLAVLSPKKFESVIALEDILK